MTVNPEPERKNTQSEFSQLCFGSNLTQRFFSGLVEHVFFSKLGRPDVKVVDYVTDLLIRSISPDQFKWPYTLISDTTAPIIKIPVTDIDGLEELNIYSRRLPTSERLQVQAALGDVSLVSSGYFPSGLSRRGKNVFDRVVSSGKAAYMEAANIAADSMDDGLKSDLFNQLADQFELVMYGIRQVNLEIHSGQV